MTRRNGLLTLWLDGYQDATTLDTHDYQHCLPLLIGDLAVNPRTDAYVDEIRITKGLARYTAPFTPQQYFADDLP